jgi:hypothetical protein
MQNLKKSFFRLSHYLDRLKNNKRTLTALLILDIILSIGSNVVDFPWLLQVPRHLVIFTPICSLYPLLLTIWLLLYAYNKKIPGWFTAFLFMGISSYGIMAAIYFPLYMTWKGINFHDIASIFWVAAYGIQAFVIASELKKLPWYQYALIFGYFFFKDYSDRYLGTFLDVTFETYPESFKLFFTVCIVLLHIMTAFLVIYLPRKKN